MLNLHWKVLSGTFFVIFCLLMIEACGSSSSTATTYTVGGTVSGLDSGKSVALQNNAADTLTVSTNSSFTFATALANAAAYAVTVSTQPDSQTCLVTHASGTISSANVTDVTVTCSAAALITVTDYVTAAEAVAPAFTAPTASVASPFKDTNTWGYRAYEIAVIFASNAASLGTNNIYNNVTTAQNVFDSFRALTDLPDYAFTSTFTEPCFATQGTYQYAGNYSEAGGATGGSAVSEASDSTVSLFSTAGLAASASSGIERNAMKASYGDVSKALVLDVQQYVDYTDAVYTGSNSGKFIMRMQVGGNADTHTFDSLKVVKYNPGASPDGSDGYYINIVGKGVSQGTGQYFLFRITDTSGIDPISATDGYFCIAADSLTASTNFDTPQTEGAIANTNCASYLTDVKNMVPINVATDVPTEAFDVSIPGNPKAFVMEANPLPSP